MILLNDHTPPSVLDGTKGIVFDCDGVLFDSWGANKAYYNSILAALGLEPMNADQERYVHAHAVLDSVAYITPPQRREEAEAFRAAIDYKDLIVHMIPEPGLYEMLATLRMSGLNVGILTNRTTTMDFVLATFNLAQFFSPVVTARDVTPKPHPAGLHKILHAWNMAPEEIIYIGDSDVDAKTVVHTSVPFWSYKNEQLPCDYLIQDFWCLRRLVMNARPL